LPKTRAKVATVLVPKNSRTFQYLFPTYSHDILPHNIKTVLASFHIMGTIKLEFNDFQKPLPSNSKTFKILLGFQGFSGFWKNRKKNLRSFKDLWPPCKKHITLTFVT